MTFEDIFDKLKKINRKYLIAGFLVLFVLVVGLILIIKRDSGTEKINSSYLMDPKKELSEETHNSKSEDEICEIPVQIAGAINQPDVYCMDVDSIVNDLVEDSGGFEENACQLWIDKVLNLASVVEPNSKLYIPFEEDYECEEDYLLNAGVAGAGDSGTPESPAQINSSQAQVANSQTTPNSSICSDGKISINDASLSQLQEISGVGPSTAEKIVEARPYSKIEDIKDVKGIGDATFEKMEEDICL